MILVIKCHSLVEIVGSRKKYTINLQELARTRSKYKSNAQNASEIVKTFRTLESGFSLVFFLFLTILLFAAYIYIAESCKKGERSSSEIEGSKYFDDKI